MALDEADAVHQQDVGAALGKGFGRLRDCQAVAAIGRGGGIDRRAGERRPFPGLGGDLLGERHDDAELRILDQRRDCRRQDAVGLDQPGALCP